MYRWESDGSLVNYTHWGTEEPNDFAGVEDCVAVWGGSSAGFWNDDYCDSEKYYICEKPGGKRIFFVSLKYSTITLRNQANIYTFHHLILTGLNQGIFFKTEQGN